MTVSLTGILKKLPEGEFLEAVKVLRARANKHLGLIDVPDDKLHITLAHQSNTKALKGVPLPALDHPLTLGDLHVVERAAAGDIPAKRSAFVRINEQEPLHKYIADLGLPSEGRDFHISLGNLTGNPMDSVGHLPEMPIMHGATRVELPPLGVKESMDKLCEEAFKKGAQDALAAFGLTKSAMALVSLDPNLARDNHLIQRLNERGGLSGRSSVTEALDILRNAFRGPGGDATLGRGRDGSGDFFHTLYHPSLKTEANANGVIGHLVLESAPNGSHRIKSFLAAHMTPRGTPLSGSSLPKEVSKEIADLLKTRLVPRLL